jgi:hypothetical protein
MRGLQVLDRLHPPVGRHPPAADLKAGAGAAALAVGAAGHVGIPVLPPWGLLMCQVKMPFKLLE